MNRCAQCNTTFTYSPWSGNDVDWKAFCGSECVTEFKAQKYQLATPPVNINQNEPEFIPYIYLSEEDRRQISEFPYMTPLEQLCEHSMLQICEQVLKEMKIPGNITQHGTIFYNDKSFQSPLFEISYQWDDKKNQEYILFKRNDQTLRKCLSTDLKRLKNIFSQLFSMADIIKIEVRKFI